MEMGCNPWEMSRTIRASLEPPQSLLGVSHSLVYIYIALVSCLLDSLSNSTTVLPNGYILIVPFQCSPLQLFYKTLKLD